MPGSDLECELLALGRGERDIPHVELDRRITFGVDW